MLKTVVVEDEIHILNMMKLFITENTKYELAAAFSNPAEAIKAIPSLKPDVLFIDIEMPGLNGLEVAAKVKTDSNQIVFTTAYSQYAVDAFRVQASDYLLKPVTPEAIDSIAGRLEKTKRLITPQLENKIPYEMTVHCFGSFHTKNKNDQIVKWPTKKTEELFAYFLLKKNEIVNKWIIADVLWPEMNGEKAVHNVHNTVYRLKKTIRQFALPLTVQTINEGYTLEITGKAWIDFHQFMEEIERNEESLNSFHNLYQLYTGPLFNDKDYIWSMNVKETLEMAHMRHSKWLIQHFMEQDRNVARTMMNKYMNRYPLDHDLTVCLESL